MKCADRRKPQRYARHDSEYGGVDNPLYMIPNMATHGFLKKYDQDMNIEWNTKKVNYEER
jgi:hypothetical protein